MSNLENKFNADEIMSSWITGGNDQSQASSETEQVSDDTSSEEEITNVEDSDENKVEETTTDTQEPKAEETTVEGDIDNWDSQDSEVKNESKGEFDYSTLSNDLGLEVKSKEDLVNAFKSLKEQTETLSTQTKSVEDYLNTVPSELREAIEVAKNGGDFLQYLKVSEVNYDAIDTTEVVLEEIRAQFEPGEEGDERFKEWVDMNAPLVKREAVKLKEQYKAHQAAEKQRLQAETIRRKQEADIQLKAAIESIDAIEVEGMKFKLTPEHKTKGFNTIANGKLMNEMFYGKDGKIDFKKTYTNYMKAQMFDKVVGFVKKQTTNQTKKEVFTELTNSTVKKPQATPIPEKSKDLQPVELWMKNLGMIK